MGIIIVIVGMISIVAAAVLLTVREKVRASERKKYYRAAHRIIREQYLDGAIKNGETQEFSGRRRLMIALKIKGKKGMGYVFDPAQEIRIGRSMEGNDICIQDLGISSHHCCIFTYEDKLCIKDSGSANGTIVKPRCGRRELLFDNMTFLRNKSKILVGSTCFVITLFYCELAAE